MSSLKYPCLYGAAWTLRDRLSSDSFRNYTTELKSSFLSGDLRSDDKDLSGEIAAKLLPPALVGEVNTRWLQVWRWRSSTDGDGCGGIRFLCSPPPNGLVVSIAWDGCDNPPAELNFSELGWDKYRSPPVTDLRQTSLLVMPGVRIHYTYNLGSYKSYWER
ncbi:MAG: hypothetical protein FJ405_14930 [Verrucomicrobia bacterium]|nr:hypothetical protein [Verrucomicrobiota bacterium]